MNVIKIVTLCLISILVISCTPDTPENIDRLIVRLKVDPERVNPLLHSTSESREVYQLVMFMPADVDPITMEYRPLLIKDLPEAVKVENSDLWAYNFSFLPDAVWTDGRPVLAEDYLFTFKTMYHKGVNLAAYKAHYSAIIKDFIIDPNNPRNFSIHVEKPNMNKLTAISGVEVYPRHYYDPNDALGKYSLADLQDDEKYDELIKNDPALAEFGTQFHDAKYSNEVVQGAGPYELVSWETDQYIRLVKKKDYWGANYPDRIWMNAEPEEIIFQIVQDDVIAISQLKGGDLDLTALQSTTGERFEDLKKDELLIEKFNFYTPQLPRYYNLILNNESPLLEDKKVRRALAHLIDVDRLIEVVEGGNGKRAITVISPNRPYYNNDLKPIPFSPESAKNLLAEAGWTDTDGNGIVDKVINGQKTDLSLRFFSTNSALGQRVALAMKEGASEANVDIDIITQSFRVTLPQHIRTGDFEIAARSLTFAPIDQPSLFWSSEAIGGTGHNWNRYSNDRIDQICESLKSGVNEPEKTALFKEFQKIIYDDQVQINLYSPVEKILVSKKYDPLITSRKPGYMANSFKPAE